MSYQTWIFDQLEPDYKYNNQGLAGSNLKRFDPIKEEPIEWVELTRQQRYDYEQLQWQRIENETDL